MNSSVMVGQRQQGTWVKTGAKHAYLVEPLTEPAQIAALLSERRAYAAYALGQLQEPLFSHSGWWLAHSDAEQAILSHSRGDLGNALFAVGDAAALEAALLLHPGPLTTFATCQPEHLPVIRRFFRLQQETVMLRMAVNAQAFRPVTGLARRLSGYEIHQINRLYNSERPGGYYAAANIETGVYYGVFEEGRLVAIAGTHVVSPSQGVAVVGNVFTHPRHRGRGHATLVTSAVTSDLLVRCGDVVLTVDPNNTPAVRAYQRLGYCAEGYLIETAAVRRLLKVVSSWLRRLAAHQPARRQGKEEGTCEAD